MPLSDKKMYIIYILLLSNMKQLAYFKTWNQLLTIYILIILTEIIKRFVKLHIISYDKKISILTYIYKFR